MQAHAEAHARGPEFAGGEQDDDRRQKGLPTDADGDMTIGHDARTSVATAATGCPEPRVRWAHVLAAWAAGLPLRDVYFFDRRPEQTVLSIAVEYNGTFDEQALQRWQKTNSTDFADLQAALAMPVSLFPDDDHDGWRRIRNAARVPLLTVGKVRVLNMLDDVQEDHEHCHKRSGAES